MTHQQACLRQWREISRVQRHSRAGRGRPAAAGAEDFAPPGKIPRWMSRVAATPPGGHAQLVVRTLLARGKEAVMFKRVLVPLDFSAPSDAALEYARSVAARYGSS